MALEDIGRSEIVVAVSRDTATLTQAANVLALSLQGVVLVFFVGLYIAYLSLLTFVLTLAIVGLAGLLFHAKSRQIREGMNNKAEAWEGQLYERTMDLLEGFKEVRLNNARSST